MGAAASQPVLEALNSLERVCGPETLPLSNPDWERCLALATPLLRLSPDDVQKALGPSCDGLSMYARRTGNMRRLCLVALRSVEALTREGSVKGGVDRVARKDSEETYPIVRGVPLSNLLCALAGVARTFNRRHPDAEWAGLLDHFKSLSNDIPAGSESEALKTQFPGSTLLQRLTTASLSALNASPAWLSAPDYAVQLSLITLILALLSPQLHHTSLAESLVSSPCVRAALCCTPLLAARATEALLRQSVRRQSPPVPLQAWYPSDARGALRTVLSFAGVAWRLPLQALSRLRRGFEAGKRPPAVASAHPPPLGEMAALLLCVLHFSPAPTGAAGNPFAGAVGRLADAAEERARGGPEDQEPHIGLPGTRDLGDSPATPSTPPLSSPAVPRLSFSQLYTAACCDAAREDCLLLHYALLIDAASWREFVLARADAESLLLPLLGELSALSDPAALEARSPRAHLLLTLVLVLSQDAGYAEALRAVLVRCPDFMRPRSQGLCSLAAAASLVLLRIAHAAAGRPEHLPLLAAAASAFSNLTAGGGDLHPAVAPRVLALLDRLARWSARLTGEKDGPAAPEPASSAANGADSSGAPSPTAESPSQASLAAVSLDEPALCAVREAQGMLVEALDASLRLAPAHCAHLLYALVSRPGALVGTRDSFGRLPSSEPPAALSRVLRAADHFARAADALLGLREAAGEGPPSAAQVLEDLKAALRSWRPEGGGLAPRRWLYHEDQGARAGYFVPYAWSFVVSRGGDWGEVRLFQLHTDPGEAPEGQWGAEQGVDVV